jgi:spore coat-associated protein N
MGLHRFTTKKVLATIGALGTAAAMAGLGTFATFTSSTSANQSVASGTVVIGLGSTGASTNRLSVNASAIAAGDTMQRSVDLVETGTVSLASVTLSTTATTSSALDTDTTAGLQMVIDKCSVPWTEAGSSPAFTYTCTGTTSTVLASRAVVGSALALSNLTLAAGTDHLRVTLTLPSASTLQGLSSTISYAFTATQRTATNA